MDKGLEKIYILNRKLNFLEEQLSEKVNQGYNKIIEKGALINKELDLDQEIIELEKKQRKIKNIEQNIKNQRNKTIIKTVIFLLLSHLVSILIIINPSIKVIVAYSIYELLAIFASFSAGESGNYYSNRKYLKQNNFDEILISINEKKNKIIANNKTQTKIENEINLLAQEIKILQQAIEKTELNIDSISNIRKEIIDNYLENNKDIELLLNNGYDSYSEEQEEKSKQLIKE